MTGPAREPGRLGAGGIARGGSAGGGRPADEIRGSRILIDLRPLQEPGRSPETADYLETLLRALAATPLPGERFVTVEQAGLPDPTAAGGPLDALPVVGRRHLPPTRLLRAAALTTDPFLLRTASLAPALGDPRGLGRADRESLFHTASGSVPIASRLPVVVTLLDLAPWELPEVFGRSVAARFGHRLRARILRDAAAVLVPTEAAATGARRLLRIRPGRLHVVPLAPRDEFRALGRSVVTAAAAPAGAGVPAGLPARYLVHPGRFDARSDLDTLVRALAELAVSGRPASLDPEDAWPPRVLVVDAPPEDREGIGRAAARYGIGELFHYVPHLELPALAAVVAAGRALVLPLLSAAGSLPALDALAAGVPVVASAVGGLPAIVGASGPLVRPRDPGRLAAALAAVWSDDRARERFVLSARAGDDGRTWHDVARETRTVYADVTAAGVARTGGDADA